jgi:UDP-N-acetylmuramate--alanine ligase
LGAFRGTGRRFELRGEAGGVTVIDDYAHHPTEIQATLRAARARYPQRRIWVVWQPHTYSRLRTLFDDFVAAFAEPGVGAAAKTVDEVIVTEIAARKCARMAFRPVAVDAYRQALRSVGALHGGPHTTFVRVGTAASTCWSIYSLAIFY